MTTVLSIVAIAVSVAALAVSWWLGLRSARAAEQSSVDARRVASAEVNRDHEMYRPLQSTATFEKVHDQRTGKENLFLVFTPGRTYRIAGDAITDAGSGREARMPLDLGNGLARAGTPVRLFIGELTGGKGIPLPKALRLRFWPPAEGDPGESWSCQCGRPLHPSGALHWEWRIELPNDIDYDIMESLG
jgi:hypothetical protein